MVRKNYLDVNKYRYKGKDIKRRNKKWARQRVHRGFCDWDWWNLDCYLCNLLSSSIRHLAENSAGWSQAIASSYEEYQKRLYALADRFEEMAEWENIHQPPQNCNWDWYKEDAENLQKFTKETFNELGEVFWTLWD